MDNSGHGPLRVPGLNDDFFLVDEQLDYQHRFAHGFGDWVQMPAVTAREFAMVQVMNDITDKPRWQEDVFRPEVVQAWHEEAVAAHPLISEKAWDWCVAELRDKAKEYDTDGFLRVLDTGSCVCKSDALVPETLRVELAAQIQQLRDEMVAGNRDDGSSPSVPSSETDIVDPCLYPLVFGKTRVLSDGGQVGLSRAAHTYGNTVATPAVFDERVNSSVLQAAVDNGQPQIEWETDVYGLESCSFDLESYFWSYKFQRLPCEVEFKGKTSTDIRITSYINSLHPDKGDVYRSLEKLLSCVIRPWNSCILKAQEPRSPDPTQSRRNNRRQRGRVPLRIVTYGVQWDNHLPEWALEFRRYHTYPDPTEEEYRQALRYLELNNTFKLDSASRSEFRRIFTTPWSARNVVSRYELAQELKNTPGPSPELWVRAEQYWCQPDKRCKDTCELPEDWRKDAWSHLQRKQRQLISLKHPQPGVAVSYVDWKAGRGTDKAVVDMVKQRRVKDLRNHGMFKEKSVSWYNPTPSIHTPYNISLEKEFRVRGLQVVVGMSSIELTPDTPRYKGYDWHLQGLITDHIIATAIYVTDSYNVTDSVFSFRQETDISWGPYRADKDSLGQESKSSNSSTCLEGRDPRSEVEALAEILGLTSGHLLDVAKWEAERPFQNLGHVSMPQGRLITFPNTMESRRHPFELVDVTVPGHHRCIMFYLVDPNYRVCSTRNVPPQQRGWWEQPVRWLLASKGLSVELVNMIMDLVDYDWLIDKERAAAYKEEMKKEQGWMTIARNCKMEYGSFR